MPNSGAPLDYFLHSYGPAAKSTMVLGWIFTAIVSVVCIVIAVLLLLAVTRKRALQEQDISHNEHEGMRWIYVGTGISIGILLLMTVYALVALNQVAEPASPGLTLNVTGYDWWWKIDYGANDPAHHFVTANEIHIPVGVPVRLNLDSADVIHAFWVPTLAGKTQMIPGITNHQWIQADQPGIYRGQCTQYCGVQHAHMAVEVVAQSMSEFLDWQCNQLALAQTDQHEANAAGRKLFVERCGACHTVRGTEANGTHAPDLTHLQTRRQLAAGLLTNTPEHLADWIAHVQELKPGARMPDFALTSDESSQLSAFLATLH